MEEKKIDSQTFMFTIFVLYRSHLITRNHLTKLFEVIKEPMPDDLAKFLVEEEARKG